MSRRARKPPSTLTARTADRHALYEIAVQRPEVIVGFVEELAEATDRRPIKRLREDFCGTANLASFWVADGDDHEAVGVDLDAEVIDWAERRNRKPLGGAGERLTLIEGDVMTTETPPADALVALNFSYCIYHDRAALLAYLRRAHANLAPGGVMLCDTFGGPESIKPSLDVRHFSGFTYQWEQRAFDPVTNRIDCRIHFRFPNGSTMRDAFSYHWRMWSIPELREAMAEVGFTQTGVYFEAEDGFIDDPGEEELDAWVAYVVGLRD
jgi:SAM-dependent methyltransferase